MNNNLYNAGRSIAQNGGSATPKQPTYQKQNAIDAGYASVRRAPPPPPPPSMKKK